MKKTKIIAVMLLAVVLCAVGVIGAYAEEANGPLNVFVTISNSKGELVLSQEIIAVSDADADGKITINDALYLAHEAKYEGGAAAGFASADTDYGKSLTKLWGEENMGAFGYYVNNASPMSLGDEIKDGDYINAFAYTDTTTWSDVYSYFDIFKAGVLRGATVELVLSYQSYDENWNVVALPVAGAKITINGEETSYVTDENGKCTVVIDERKTAVISATSSELTLVPPVCVVEVVSSPCSYTWIWYAVGGAAVIIAIAVVIIVKRKKK
ncbi:MAG: DUF4179 domain-containing protein [Clostridiales bacterium]|nr:DUF4179 domain-containing protein [Clostridiales bacterium]